uniref:Uncharacterized protein n=1 Tax=Arion vulgaris TaxID=1028688 RepID=A0A0B7BYS0_9EUPU
MLCTSIYQCAILFWNFCFSDEVVTSHRMINNNKSAMDVVILNEIHNYNFKI